MSSIWCSLNKVSQIAIGSIGMNPFPDASEKFFKNFSNVLSQGLNHKIEVITPYQKLKKHDLIHKHSQLPL